MKFIIMLTIVIGLALADFITGVIKAAIKKDVSSQMRRTGGLHKIMEVTVMLTACGLEFGIGVLGDYYNEPRLAEITGMFTSGTVFVWIVFMEITSILDNYLESNPKAKWARWLLKRLRVFQQNETKEDKDDSAD